MITYNKEACSITMAIDEFVYMFHDCQRSNARYGADYPMTLLFNYIQEDLGLPIDHFSRSVDHEAMLEFMTIVFDSEETLFRFKLLYSNDFTLYTDVIDTL